MTLVPIKIPAGFHANGTDMDSEGRWHDGSLVRWHDGSLRPIGGWVERFNSAYAAAPRGMITWEDQATSRWIAAGTYNKLYVSTSGGTTYDITPVGLTAGAEDAVVNTGFGGGYYGTSFYGQARPDYGNYDEATTWSLDTWGQYLVACSNDDGKLYEWQLNTAAPAAAITNAPTGNLGLVVTEERFLMALGAGGNVRKIQWCDFEDNTLWTPASTNQAGDITLQTSGRIMAGVRTQGQTIILTDQDAHRGVYIGPPYIYQFERVGDACGLAARKAVANTPAGVFWMSQNGFFTYNGSSVSPVPCEVHDAVFNNINTAQISKCWAVSNGQHNEVWFFYPSAGSNEIDKYVAFDYREGHWIMGDLARTSGVARGVFSSPIWADASGAVYNHEIGFNYGGATPFAESGPYKIAAGERFAVIRQIIPDEVNLGDTRMTFKSRLYPTATETTHGPYTMANPTSVRLQGRQIRVRVEGVTQGDWRIGTTRFDIIEGSKR